LAIEKLSRKEPPRSDIATITPALVGPWRTVFHSSSLKADWSVIGLLGWAAEYCRSERSATVAAAGVF
jgi:hypothetical protein